MSKPRSACAITRAREGYRLMIKCLTISQIELVFEEIGKPKYLSEQGREQTTNLTHIRRLVRESNPGHIGGRQALLPLRLPALVSVISRFFLNARYKMTMLVYFKCFVSVLSNWILQKPLKTSIHTRTLHGNRILTSFLSLAYFTIVGSSVILIPSPLDTDAICWQNFLRWPSLHQREGAKQAKAQVWMRAPS